MALPIYVIRTSRVTRYVAFCVWLISRKHNVFKAHLYCTMYQNFILWPNDTPMYVHRIDPHCLQILYLWIDLLATFICSPRVSTHSTSTVLRRCAQSSNKFASPGMYVSAETLCLSVSVLILWTSGLFMVYLLPRFLHFCAFFWWFHCSEWPLSRVLRCYLVFLKQDVP